jgi:hypothetical protein
MSPCSGRKSPIRVSPGSGPSKVKSRQQESRSSNPFKVLGDSGLEKALEEEFAPRSPTTFLEVFESALSSRDKGNGVMGDQGDGGRGSWVTKEMGVLLRGDSLLPVYEDISLECKGFK